MSTTLVRPTISDISRLSGRKVRLSWESTPKLTGGKANPMKDRVTKLSTALVTLGETGAYAKRKVEEGEFSSSDEVQKPKWGSRVGNTCIIEHKGNMYVDLIVEEKPKRTFFLDDSEIDQSEIVGLPKDRRDSNVLYCRVKAENVKILDILD